MPVFEEMSKANTDTTETETENISESQTYTSFQTSLYIKKMQFNELCFLQPHSASTSAVFYLEIINVICTP